MVKKALFLLAIFFFIAPNLFADTITLKSGKQIDAKILERTNERVKVEIAGVPITYFLDEIDSINGEKVSLSSQNESTPEPAKEIIPTTSQEPAQESPSSPEVQSIVSKELVQEASNNSATPTTIGDKPKVPAAVVLTVLIVVFIVTLLFYIYYSVCLQLISKKTNQGPIWLAWVPIAQLFLMCKIAGISYLWLLLLLLSFIPIVGMLSSLGLGGFIWYKIALARQKPGWLGILTVIPIVGLVFTGYLAFAE